MPMWVLPLASPTRAARDGILQHLLEAQVVITDWRLEYNHYRPHQSLGYLSPAATVITT